jgi:hypothetical protein
MKNDIDTYMYGVMNVKILSLLFVLLMISPVYATFETDPVEIEMEVKTTPREQMGLDYAIERLIMLIPRGVLMFVRDNIQIFLFPFLPFFLPPLYFIFGNLAAPITGISSTLLASIILYPVLLILFIMGPPMFPFLLVLWPFVLIILLLANPPLALIDFARSGIITFLVLFMPLRIASMLSGILLLPLFAVFYLLPQVLFFLVAFPLILIFIPFFPFFPFFLILFIPWALIAVPLSIAMIIFPAPFRAFASAIAEHLPFLRVLITG